MTIVRSQVELDHESGLAADRIVNTFHHLTAGTPPTPTQLDVIRDQIVAAYTAVQAPGTTALINSLPDVLAGTWRIKHYDAQSAPPNVPLRIDTPAAFVPGGGAPLPLEVALCLSYKITPSISGVQLQSQRGRVYFGPFGTARNGIDGRPTPTLIDQLVGVGGLLMASGSADVDWVVYSPTLDAAVAGLIGSDFIVNQIYVDNEWDTQRRRGREATARTILNAA